MARKIFLFSMDKYLLKKLQLQVTPQVFDITEPAAESVFRWDGGIERTSINTYLFEQIGKGDLLVADMYFCKEHYPQAIVFLKCLYAITETFPVFLTPITYKLPEPWASRCHIVNVKDRDTQQIIDEIKVVWQS